MNQISLLSQETIDKIAAGEVIERPASIVKELVENAIDAGANAVTVEIKEGGISLIRITDNGSGIEKDQVRTAFLRHATSKIRTVDDLLTAGTLGFRGEALSSIAAVCQVELITKTAGSITGTRYVIEGGVEKSLEEIGAPEGTTFLVRNLFYHTPARKKFLKTATTEAGYVGDLMERMALSNPGISFKFINNNDVKLHTSGNSNLRDIIYGVYGRDIASNVVKTDFSAEGFRISGFIGKPVVSRGNRNYENYFVNGRYVKSSIVARAIEDAYKPFMMNHRYPFTALSIDIDTAMVDVNVHPTKMEVRFADQMQVYTYVLDAVKEALAGKELIPEFTVDLPKEKKQETVIKKSIVSEGRKTHTFTAPEPFETTRSKLISEANSPYEVKYPQRTGAFRPVTGNVAKTRLESLKMGTEEKISEKTEEHIIEKTVASPILSVPSASSAPSAPVAPATSSATSVPSAPVAPATSSATSVPEGMEQVLAQEVQKIQEQNQKPVQMELFDDKLLDAKSRKRHKLIGQLFDTYWLIEFDEKLFIVDQHAAHEKVMYERMLQDLNEKKQTSQMITPPMIVSVSLQEEDLLKKYIEQFRTLGFEIEHFGGKEYAISAVPANMYNLTSKELFIEILDSLGEIASSTSERVLEKLASMSCKAAVKGNNRLSFAEADALMEELLSLENPYNCPHGRPTIISMTKYELEKKFKRII